MSEEPPSQLFFKLKKLAPGLSLVLIFGQAQLIWKETQEELFTPHIQEQYYIADYNGMMTRASAITVATSAAFTTTTTI